MLFSSLHLIFLLMMNPTVNTIVPKIQVCLYLIMLVQLTLVKNVFLKCILKCNLLKKIINDESYS